MTKMALKLYSNFVLQQVTVLVAAQIVAGGVGFCGYSGVNNDRTTFDHYSNYQSAVDSGEAVYGLEYYLVRVWGDNVPISDNPGVCYGKIKFPYDLCGWNPSAVRGYHVCPDPTTNNTADSWCCGGEGHQECCSFYDDYTRKVAVILGVYVFLSLVIGLTGLGYGFWKLNEMRHKNRDGENILS